MNDPLKPALAEERRFDSGLHAWVLSRYADVTAAFRDPELNPGPPVPAMYAARYSALRIPAVALPIGAGKIDLIQDVAEPWALAAAASVRGMEIGKARELAAISRHVFEAAAEPFDPGRQRAGQAATADLSTEFKEEAGAVDLQAFTALCHTLPCFLGNAWLALLQHRPGNFDAGPSAMEELLRYAGPASAQLRTNAAGERVVLLVASANRDAAHFAEPEALLLDRRPNRHLAFGYGAHACLGAALIRAVSGMAMREFAMRLPGMEMVEYKIRQRFAIRSLESLVAGV